MSGASDDMPHTQPTPTGVVLGGRYQLIRRLGAGGMGEVHEAVHQTLNQRVAVKMLNSTAAAHAGALERFHREARAAATLKSEHVARMIDAGATEEGAPYIVMELLEGLDLSDLLEARGPLPVGEAVGYVLQASEAIAEAHALGIVHRDLKPANLFLASRVDGSPLVKVLDFGISKLSAEAQQGESSQLTRTHDVVGSPSYMSPEQLRSSKDVDARADIWSLGIILYELIAGAQPFQGNSLTELTIRVVQDEPAPLRSHRPDVPEGLAAAVHQCLAKQRDQRFSSVAELARAIAPFANIDIMPDAAARIERVSGPRLGSDSSPGRLSGVPAPSSNPQIHGATSTAWADTHPSMPPQKLPFPPSEITQATEVPKRNLPLGLIAVPVGLVVVGLLGAVALLRPGPTTNGGTGGATSPLPSDRVHLAPITSASSTPPVVADPSATTATSAALTAPLPSSRGPRLVRTPTTTATATAAHTSNTPTTPTTPLPSPTTTTGKTSGELPSDRK